MDAATAAAKFGAVDDEVVVVGYGEVRGRLQELDVLGVVGRGEGVVGREQVLGGGR